MVPREWSARPTESPSHLMAGMLPAGRSRCYSGIGANSLEAR